MKPVPIHGDMRDVLKRLAESRMRFDACVTDPPYHLQSIVKRFGKASINDQTQTSERVRNRADGYARSASGFMGQQWDGGDISMQPETWRAVYDVLKPGGHMLVFGGTRTWHRIACAIEDAGFDIRDTICWLFGTGFPKSHDVSKSIDKASGTGGMPLKHQRALATEIRQKREKAGISRSELASWFPQYSAVTANWERLDDGFRIPTEADYSVLVDRLGIRDLWREMLRAEDLRLITDMGGTDRRGDGTVYGLAHVGVRYEAVTPGANKWHGWGSALKPAFEPIILARKPLEGTIAQNVLAHGCGGLNIDLCRIGMGHEYDPAKIQRQQSNRRTWEGGEASGFQADHVQETFNAKGRWPANVIHDGSDEVVAAFPQAPGQIADVSHDAPSTRTKHVYGKMNREGEVSADRRYTERGSTNFAPLPGQRRGDVGSAARFFYSAKATKADRAGSMHPTVKPISLMRYLCRLITPPGGAILDPFAGSGTTLAAAHAEGFWCVGIEREDEYFADIARRVLDLRG